MPTAAPVATTFRILQVPLLRPSPSNPRRHAPAAAGAELVESVRTLGVLEPLIVRPLTLEGEGFSTHEIVAGHRRFAAATAAGLWEVPCIVRDLTDAQALEIAVTENNQRQDVHPLDEAEAFARLRQMAGYTPADIAARLGRPVRYVTDRLRLLSLSPGVLTSFEADDITLGHALLLARVPEARQGEALDACFDEHLNYEDDDGDAKQVLRPVRDLQSWIDREIRLDLGDQETQEAFPELAAEVAQAAAAGAPVVLLSERWDNPRQRPTGDEPLDRYWWTEDDPGTPGAVKGVIVQGRRRGAVVWVTLKADQKPERATKTPKTAAERAADRQMREDEKQRAEERKAAEALGHEVTRRGALALAASDYTLSGPVLEALANGLAGAETFDRDVIAAVCEQLQVPADVFSAYSGQPARAKLDPETLRSVVAVMAVGAVWSWDDAAPAFKAFGVDLKRIERDILKEQLAAKRLAVDASEGTPQKKASAKKAKAKKGGQS